MTKVGIDHFTVLCSFTRPLNKSEAGVHLALNLTAFLVYSLALKQHALHSIIARDG